MRYFLKQQPDQSEALVLQFDVYNGYIITCDAVNKSVAQIIGSVDEYMARNGYVEVKPSVSTNLRVLHNGYCCIKGCRDAMSSDARLLIMQCVAREVQRAGINIEREATSSSAAGSTEMSGGEKGDVDA